MSRDNESPANASPAKSLRDKVLPTLSLLRERFPAAFLPEDESPLPLQVGILQELFDKANDVSRRRLRWAVYYYANNIRYQQALIHGDSRYDLNGQPVGEVTAEHREAAKLKLKELQPKKVQRGTESKRQKNYQSRTKSRFPFQSGRAQSKPMQTRAASAPAPAVVVRQRKAAVVTAKVAVASNVKSTAGRGVLSLKRRVSS